MIKLNSMINDTIVALSTAPIVSAIGVIRMSGDKSFNILRNIINKDIPSFKVRESIVCKIIDSNKEMNSESEDMENPLQ